MLEDNWDVFVCPPFWSMAVLIYIDPDVKIIVNPCICDVDLAILYNDQILKKLSTVYLA